MTSKERKDFLQMKAALIRIRQYQTPSQLKKDSDKDWGLNYNEALEMAYENIRQEANQGLGGVRKLKEASNGNP